MSLSFIARRESGYIDPLQRNAKTAVPTGLILMQIVFAIGLKS